MDSEIKMIPNNRKVTSIFVDPDVWQNFLKKCRTQSQSTCGVLEAFMYAYVKGVPDGPSSPLPVVNVNLTVNRVVKRIHRVETEYKRSFKGRMLCPNGTSYEL